MKIFKTIQKHIKEEKIVDCIICDICKNKIEKENAYENNEINIYAKIGNYYPEGDSREINIIDVCLDCFLYNVKPLIENTFKIKFREISADDFYEKEGGI